MFEIFLYSDYREVLRDFYQEKKKSEGFTYRSFAIKAGIKSAGFIQLVIEGKKNLSEASGLQLAGAMEFDEEKTEHFLDLVRLSRAKTLDHKKHFLDKIDARRNRNRPSVLSEDSAHYLMQWFLPALREMVAVPGFREDPTALAKHFAFPVEKGEIETGLLYLERSGFLVRESNGKLNRKERTLSSGNPKEETRLHAAGRLYHARMIDLARQALESMPRNQRNVTGSTLSFSKVGYEKAIQRIRALRHELLELAASDPEANRVYQLAVHLFPLTKEFGDEG